MDGIHPQQADPRPKRRKDKDNPYTIFTIGIETDSPRYYLSFQDSSGIKRTIKIDKTLFTAFDTFELDDLSFMNEVDNHYEHSEQTDTSLNRRALQPRESVEETVARRVEAETLHRAIAKLPEKQRRRLVLYYFGEFTYEQIAEMEGCTISPVKRSIDTAIEKLKNILTLGGKNPV